jgi:hypothetical protein
MTITRRIRPIFITLFASLAVLGLMARESVAEATPDGVAPEVWARIAPQMKANGALLKSGAILTDLEKKLTASDKAAADSLGYAVSVAGDVALVGARNASPGGMAKAGAAYVFERNAGGTNAWGQVATLIASDKAVTNYFGCSVSVAGDVALVGASDASPGGTVKAGAAYVFVRNEGGANAWGQVAKLTAGDKAAYDNLGWSVSVAGDVALVGAYDASPEGVLYAGAAYLFERNSGGANAWGQVKKLTAADLAADAAFGYAVSVAGDVALIGAVYAAPEGASGAGAAYLFERNTGGANAWGQVKKLTALDKAIGDNFGVSVSVAGDVALVGAYASDPGSLTAAGAAYLFERDAGGADGWGQVKKLTASDKVAGDNFGVSVSVAGDVALVGAYNADPGGLAQAGAAYLFERNAGGTNAWGEVKKLSAPDKAANDTFGYAVSVAEGMALVGAYQADPGGTANAGAAYVIPFNSKEWSEKNKLTASDKSAGDYFGISVSVAGDVALVGAYAASPGGTGGAGAAYLFERNAGGANAWGEVKKLTASDKAVNDYFGVSVSVAGDVALVGARNASPGGTACAGAAYLFERNAGGANAWGEVKKLTASDKAADDNFGYSVSVAGDVALVGSPCDDPGGTSDAGAAYVFERNAGGANAWGEVKKLIASDKAANDIFGYAVSVAGDVALVGAYQADPGGTEQAGAAYLFERNAGGANVWGEVKKLTASDKAEGDNFGVSVSVAGDVAMVGAYYASPGGADQAGAAYLFERNAGGANAWGEVKKLIASDKAASAYFGWSVSVADDVALVGAYNSDQDGTAQAGAAYLFERNEGGANAWGEVKKLIASDKTDYDCFGYDVSVAGDMVLVGASAADPGGTDNAGAAYLFEGLINTAASDMAVLGIDGASVASGEAASEVKGTDFGSQSIGSSVTRVFSITNSGLAALTISGWTTNGSHAASFAVSGIPAQVAPGAVSNFSVVFSPAAEGWYSASLSIVNSSSNTPYVVNLAGVVAPLARIIGLSGSLAFGNAPIGQLTTRTLTITNSGIATLTVSGITYPGGFSGAWSGTIPAGGSQSVTVTFHPLKAKNYSGTVRVNSDMTGGDNTLGASGRGVPPGQLCFAASAYSAQEGTVVKILVKRINGSAGTVSATYVMKPRTAIAGKDYVSKTGTLTWLNGQTASKAIKITLNADRKVEGSEEFLVQLKNPVGTTLATPAQAAITIVANSKSASFLDSPVMEWLRW